MNKFLTAVINLNLTELKSMLKTKPEWVNWQEKDGKNALHYLCAVPLKDDRKKQELSLAVLKFLLKEGINMNSIHGISDKNCLFPATPLWYAYTRGRNEKIYKWLLDEGADPEHCMYAIAWYDDVDAATLFKRHGASLNPDADKDSPFLAAFLWKRFRVAEWFLRNGAAVNARDQNGNTALYYAIKRKFPPDKIQLLLKYKANINSKNNEGISPLSLALLKGPKSILHALEKFRNQTA
jgi:Ankyrin repeats (many copies)